MTETQLQAAATLRNALQRCKREKLFVGIFDNSVCVWPDGTKPDPREDKRGLFAAVDEVGQCITVPGLHIDGGAGV